MFFSFFKKYISGIIKFLYIVRKKWIDPEETLNPLSVSPLQEL